jgi:protein involved in polysaccharide export with SLBB domain
LAITPGPPGVPANPYGVYRLDSGDRLRVIVFGQDNLSRDYNVDTSGNISLPLIGSVRARGLSTVQLGLNIEAELRRKYIKDPKVSVEIDAYRPFFILGEVRRPGRYPYVNAMTVEGAVAIAEGYTERAKKRMVRLTRKFGGPDEHGDGADRLSGATRRHYLRSRTLLLKLRLLSPEIPQLGSSEFHASHSALLARALRGFVSPRT